MKTKLYIIAIWLLASVQLFAQTVSVKTDTNAILIGERVRLDLNYELPNDKKPLFPLFNDTLTGQIEIIGRSLIDTTINLETKMQTLHQQLILTAFDTGYFVIPPIPFGMMQAGDTSYDVFQTEPLLLNVFTVEVDTTKDIKPIVRPIAQPYTIDEFLPWILFAFALAAIIFAIIYFIRRRKKNKPLFKKKGKPALPPHEQAMLDLDELKRKKLWQSGRLKEYQSELTDIIRHYIEGRFGINAVEMVSYEIMEALKTTSVNADALAKIAATFELADLVKFAKSGASAIENDTSYNNCIDFVNETKQLEVKEEKREEATNVQ
jgi:hypothetical protein